jgi:hypothetical protein
MNTVNRSRVRLLRHIERAALLACVLLLIPISAAAQDRCTARIEVQLDSEVSNPRDPSFLSSLTANPLYSLSWVEGDDSRAVYLLTGPGTDYGCKGGIELVRRDASILDLRVLEPGASN